MTQRMYRPPTADGPRCDACGKNISFDQYRLANAMCRGCYDEAEDLKTVQWKHDQSAIDTETNDGTEPA